MLKELPPFEFLGSIFVVNFTPDHEAGPNCARKTLHVFERAEKGLNFVETSVMNLVIILRD